MKGIIGDTGGATTPHAVVATETPLVEHTNRSSAMKLAKRLERYWHERGYYACFWANRLNSALKKLVRTNSIGSCNLIDGMPPTYQPYPE
jgi:hypothetical protein